jgi:hypothetical protein
MPPPAQPTAPASWGTPPPETGGTAWGSPPPPPGAGSGSSTWQAPPTSSEPPSAGPGPAYAPPPPPPGPYAPPGAYVPPPPPGYGYAGGYGGYTGQSTNGLAIASLILGIVGGFLCGIGSIVAIVLGAVALNQIKASNGRESGAGMAKAGIILGVVWIGLVILWIIVSAATSDSSSY